MSDHHFLDIYTSIFIRREWRISTRCREADSLASLQETPGMEPG